jgi:hypothetical protein
MGVCSNVKEVTFDCPKLEAFDCTDCILLQSIEWVTEEKKRKERRQQQRASLRLFSFLFLANFFSHRLATRQIAKFIKWKCSTVTRCESLPQKNFSELLASLLPKLLSLLW